nr:hypothetical protein [Methanobacterium formicicum]
MKKDKLHLRCEVDELTDLVHKIFFNTPRGSPEPLRFQPATYQFQ